MLYRSMKLSYTSKYMKCESCRGGSWPSWGGLVRRLLPGLGPYIIDQETNLLHPRESIQGEDIRSDSSLIFFFTLAS
jgi:hypothetical protein